MISWNGTRWSWSASGNGRIGRVPGRWVNITSYHGAERGALAAPSDENPHVTREVRSGGRRPA